MGDIEEKRTALKAIVISQMVDECSREVTNELFSWPEHVDVVRMLNEAATIICKKALADINSDAP